MGRFLQIYGDGYLPKEMDFMVVEQHPTLLNVTMHTSKVGRPPVNRPRLKPWEPPWMSDFQTRTIFVGAQAAGRGTGNGSRNWRDGLRAYSDASPSAVTEPRFRAKTAVRAAVVMVLLSVRRK